MDIIRTVQETDTLFEEFYSLGTTKEKHNRKTRTTADQSIQVNHLVTAKPQETTNTSKIC